MVHSKLSLINGKMKDIHVLDAILKLAQFI